MEPISKTKWRKAWRVEEVKKLTELATTLRYLGAINDEAAWRAAEEQFTLHVDPLLKG